MVKQFPDNQPIDSQDALTQMSRWPGEAESLPGGYAGPTSHGRG